jgi:tetratricopeptide (TPR) repeat protein
MDGAPRAPSGVNAENALQLERNEGCSMVATKVLTGDFAKSPLAEVLNVLHLDRETATLVCKNGPKKRAVFLWRGQVADVESKVQGEKLIDLLRSMDKITPEEHSRLQEQEGGHKSAGQLIVELGMLPVKDVVSLIRVHIVGVLTTLFEESEGMFKLILGEMPDRGFSVRIPVPELIFAGVKHMRSYEKLVSYLGKLDRRISVQPGRQIEKTWRLGSDDENFLQSLRQRPTYQSVLDTAGPNRLTTAALLYCLEVVGYLTQADQRKAESQTELRRARAAARRQEERVQDLQALPKPAHEQARLPKPESTGRDAAAVLEEAFAEEEAPQPEVEEADLAAYANLDSMTHYQVLGIDPGCNDAAVKAAYFRLAKLYHPDRFFGRNAEQMEEARRVFEAQSRAYNVLKDPASRHDYDRSFDTKRQGKVQAEAPKEAEEVARGRLNYQQALQALEVKNYQAAVDALKRAIDANPKDARYWGALADVQSRFARWKSESLASIERALELQPDHVEFLFLHAQLLYRQNDLEGAHRSLRRAALADRDNPKYRELLAEIEAKLPKKGRAKGSDKGGSLFGRIFGS